MSEEKYSIFPKNDTDMPDDIFRTYYMMVPGCNSLNALEGYCMHHSKDNKMFENLSINLRRAQNIIWFLLDEGGRFERFKKWEKENGN